MKKKTTKRKIQRYKKGQNIKSAYSKRPKGTSAKPAQGYGYM